MSADDFIPDMNSVEFDRLLRDYLQTRLKSNLDYFAIEGRMSPDAEGNMGVTGNYRKRPGDKNVFFTVTVNILTHVIQNLQEY
jgi:hypothetical protein